MAKYLGEGTELMQAVAGANTTTGNGFVSDDEPLPFGLFPLQSNTAYTSEGQPDNVDPHYVNGQPVSDVGYFNFPNTHMMVVAPGHLPVLSLSIPEQILTFRFTLPGNSPTLLRSIPQKGLWPYETIVEGNTIELRVHTTMRTAATPTGFIADMALSVNGQPYPGNNIGFTQGSMTSYNWTWGIESANSGTHRAVVTLEKPGPSPETETQIDTTYTQKALSLAEPLEDMIIPAGQTTPITLDNTVQWDNGDSAANQNVTWSVQVSDPSGVIPTQTKSGTGPNIHADLDPVSKVFSRGGGNSFQGRTVRLVPFSRYSGSDAVQARDGDITLTYVVNASADTYTGPNIEGVVHSPQPRYYLTQESTLPKGVHITSFTVEPSSFDPSAGENITLRAHLEITGFDAPQLNWTAKVHPESDPSTTVALFTDSGNVTSGSPGTWFADIEIPWDGHVSDNLTIPPGQARQLNPGVGIIEGGDYLVELSVAIFAPDGGDERTAQATAGFNAGSGAILRVSAGNSTRGLAHDPESPELAQARRARLLDVYRSEEAWTVQASGLRFEGAPSSVSVTFRSTVSNVSVTRPMALVNGTYVAAFTGVASLFADPGTTYSVAKLSEANVTMSRNFLDTLLGSSAYSNPFVSVGNVDLGIPDSEDVEPPSGGVPMREDNVRACGFEAVNVSLQASGLLTPMTAQVKVRHPARLAWINLHGSHAGNLSMSEAGAEPFLAPFATTKTTKTLILASCDVLDLHDYNNYFATERGYIGPTAVHAADAKLDQRHFGGETWFNLTREGPAVLLGYNAPVAELAAGLASQRLVRDFQAGSEPLTWVKSNLAQAKAELGHLWSGLNACAYDDQNYYFISYNVPPVDNGGAVVRLPSEKDIHGVFQIPRDRWGERDDWTIIPPEDIGGPVH